MNVIQSFTWGQGLTPSLKHNFLILLYMPTADKVQKGNDSSSSQNI